MAELLVKLCVGGVETGAGSREDEPMRLRWTGMAFFAAGAAAALLGGGGCYEVAYFFPSGGQGSPVTDGRRLGVASRLTGDEADGTEGQAYVILSVGEAYTADAEDAEDTPGGAPRSHIRAVRTGARTIIPVIASVVNETDARVRFETKATRLEVAGRIFGPKWSYRNPETDAADEAEGEGAAEETKETSEAAFDTVGGGTVVRYEMYFDLGTYEPLSSARVTGRGPDRGVPLRTIRRITIRWKASVGGEGGAEEKRSGEVTFARDWSGYYPPVGYGPYWGGGWYSWADPWPLGVLILRTRASRYAKPVRKLK